MSRLPDPDQLTWVEADEDARIVGEIADAIREHHGNAARHLDYRATQYRARRNLLAMPGK